MASLYNFDDVIRVDTNGYTTIGLAVDITPTNNGEAQLRVNGSGYNGWIALDGTQMYVGHNSSSRNLALQTNETNRLTINGSTGDVAVLSTTDTTGGGGGTGSLQVVGGAQVLKTLWVGTGTAAAPGTSGYIKLSATTAESSIYVKAGTTTGDTDAILYLDSTDTGECSVNFLDSGTDLFQIGVVNGVTTEFYVGQVSSTPTLGFRINTTEAYCYTGLTVAGRYMQPADAVAALDINCSLGNYFTKTINANSTFTFSSVPSSGNAYAFTLELTHTSGNVTWPTSVRWNDGAAPVLTAGRVHLFTFVTANGGTTWRGSALVNYSA